MLYDIIPLSRFGGIQWLQSSRIGRILRESGIYDHGAEGNVGAGSIVGQRSSRLFPNGREAARSVPDTLDISCLPEEFRHAARAYDVCCSGKICVSELKKLVRAGQRLKKFEGDSDVLVADSARFNSIGGGDTLIQCKQRNLHVDRQPMSVNNTKMRQPLSMEVSEYKTDNLTQTYFVARMQPAQSVRKRNGDAAADLAGDNPEVRGRAGKASGTVLKCGAESGDVPGWLRLATTQRSKDPWESISYEEVSLPVNFKARTTGYKVPGKRNYDGEFGQALASTMEATASKGGGEFEKLVEQPTLWRPAGNRSAGRITEDDHLCLAKNPNLVPTLTDEASIGNRGRVHPSQFTR